MKIAFLTSEYPHPKANFAAGIGTSIMNLANGLQQLGHEITVVIYGQDQDETFTDSGIAFYKVKNVKFKGLSRYLTQKKIQRLLNTLVREKKIDLVEVADWTGISDRLRLNCPVVIKLHGSDTYFCHLDRRPVKYLNYSREKKALQRADAHASVSKYVAEVTSKLFQLQNTFTIIPNGIDLEQFNNNLASVSSDEPTLLYFGTLIRKKGLLELPFIFNEVHRQYPRAKLMLIGRNASDIVTGNSSTWQMMQSLFDADALANVNYLGSVPYDQIKGYLANATVCVFPTFAEALPVSWIEAMAMRKAIVASNIGWAPEIIDDGVNGYVVHPKDHAEFAAKIVALLDNPALRNQMGQNARDKVIQQFSIAVVARKNEAFYDAVLAKFKTSRP
ncbi:glycosyltransferase family 4 protein [Flavobacterium sedimenticola]|uniref:Glycosyltransferase family 4 protein n=1 Tax=Flavobacterium sedimenticola TaxID=3043286 RepID=A0ABT6XRE5_9FLAO|nr:glycosyltransferase family 4 protein [Flavobacterium sedimenticola]MDI9257664.1 glycosyltransferase family 4 protein [Flavobacterium sedimenticola]